MPARPNVPKVVQIVLFQSFGADLDVVNRFYQQYTGAAGTLSDGGAATWAAAVTSAWAAHIAPLITSTFTLNKVTVTDLSTNIGGFGEDDTGSVGSVSGAAVPAGVAMVIREHIERRYRGGHPRQYVCGLPSGDLGTAQSWNSTATAAWQTAYTAFRAAAAAGCPVGIGPAVDANVSYFQGFTNHTYPSGRVRPIPTLRATPVVDVISSFSVNPKLGSQRRRNLQSL